MTGVFSETRAGSTQIAIRETKPEEREAIAGITRRAGVFDQKEIDTVYELFDSYVKDPLYGYHFLSAFAGGKLAGFACWGLTPLTEGAYDLYWICTDPGAQQKGVGRELFQAVEGEVRNRKGTLIVIWTSGTEPYVPATKFYARMGCELVGRIKNFYHAGDDLLVYVKYLS